MQTAVKSIQIREAVSPGELLLALAFINAQYRKAFGVEPSPPHHVLVAWEGSDIIGTIGINVWKESTGLRLAHLYEFDYANGMFPITLPRTVEFARWACKTGDVACALLHAATCFSLALGKEHVLCEHSLAVNRICHRYGILFHTVTDAKRNNEAIEEHHKAFYDATDARLFIFSLTQALPALQAYLQKHSTAKEE